LVRQEERIKKKRENEEGNYVLLLSGTKLTDLCVGDSQLFFTENKHATKQAVIAISLRNHLSNGTGNEGEAAMQNETELIRTIDFSQLHVIVRF